MLKIVNFVCFSQFYYICKSLTCVKIINMVVKNSFIGIKTIGGLIRHCPSSLQPMTSTYYEYPIFQSQLIVNLLKRFRTFLRSATLECVDFKCSCSKVWHSQIISSVVSICSEQNGRMKRKMETIEFAKLLNSLPHDWWP